MKVLCLLSPDLDVGCLGKGVGDPDEKGRQHEEQRHVHRHDSLELGVLMSSS